MSEVGVTELRTLKDPGGIPVGILLGGAAGHRVLVGNNQSK